MVGFDEQLGRDLGEIRDAGLWRELREIESAQSARIKFGGREFINFSSNDYLGLAGHPALGQAEDGELRGYIHLLRETAGGLFTRAPEEPDGILCHTDETGLARLIGEADTVLRF